MTPDPTIEAILEAARKRWPEATSVDVRGPRYVWTEAFGDDFIVAMMHVQVRGVGVFYAKADSLPALLAKLKGEDDA